MAVGKHSCTKGEGLLFAQTDVARYNMDCAKSRPEVVWREGPSVTAKDTKIL